MAVSGHLGDRWRQAKVKSAASANATVVKAEPGTLKLLLLTNDNAAKRYVKFYDMAVAPAATDAPTFTLMLPAGGGIAENMNLAFEVGIAYRITTGVAENDNVSTGADEVTGVLGYA